MWGKREEEHTDGGVYETVILTTLKLLVWELFLCNLLMSFQFRTCSSNPSLQCKEAYLNFVLTAPRSIVLSSLVRQKCKKKKGIESKLGPLKQQFWAIYPEESL